MERSPLAVQTCKLGGPHFRSCKSGVGVLVVPCFRRHPLVGKQGLGEERVEGGVDVGLSSVQLHLPFVARLTLEDLLELNFKGPVCKL